MLTLWRWFYRGVVGSAVLILCSGIIVVVAMNRPHVTQSNGYTNRTPEAVSATLSRSLPATASHVRHCRISIGMGGRLLLYRFSAPVADLHLHAHTEFAAHFRKPKSKVTTNSASPITESDIESYKTGFGVDAAWMLPPPGSNGTLLYEPADGLRSHRPVIFVDETNGVLYFQMTD